MRQTATRFFGVLLLLCAAATAQAAVKYPPGPGGTCPDTLKITQCEDTGAGCHPATLDTVWGVGGIITGFDDKPGAYATFFQTSGGGPFTGIQAFTGAFNYRTQGSGLALGDSIVVYGTTQEFPNPNGTSEIEGPDAIQSTDDIIVRKVNSGNALPPFYTPALTSEFFWRSSVSSATAEPWENCLVKINGPLKVTRIATPSAASPGLPTSGPLNAGSYLCVPTASLGDTILVDCVTLAALLPPAVGTTILSLQGIVNQGTTGGINSYRIQIRDGNDHSLNTPPNLSDAFPVEDNIIRVIYDRNVTTGSATNAANYSLASFGSSVDSVKQESQSVYKAYITSTLVDGDNETITVNSIVSSASGLGMTSAQSRSFINGVLDIATIQAGDPAHAFPCEDRSRFAGVGASNSGGRMSFRGVATHNYGSLYYIESAGGGQRSGVSVFAPPIGLVDGHKYLIAGAVQEFGFETEVTPAVYTLDEGVGTIPSPALQTVAVLRDTACNLSVPNFGATRATAVNNGEDYEGVLVRVEGVKCTENRNRGQSFFVAQPNPTYGDTILISNASNSITVKPDSNEYLNVQGILTFRTGTFRIQPRSNADVESLFVLSAPNGNKAAALSFAVHPNPARVARLSFALPFDGDVDVSVFDVAGRKVASVLKGHLPAGDYSREWNGLDSRGKVVGSGLYFYRLRVGSEVRVIRGTLLN